MQNARCIDRAEDTFCLNPELEVKPASQPACAQMTDDMHGPLSSGTGRICRTAAVGWPARYQQRHSGVRSQRSFALTHMQSLGHGLFTP